MIIQKLTPEELAIVEILEHPVWCAEFLRSEVDEGWEHHQYQKEILADMHPYVGFRAGRAVGKTETIVDKMVYYGINDDFFATKVLALVTPNRVHLEPIWRKLVRWLSTHPFLRHFQGTANSQVFNITLKNGLTIDCRIGGISGKGSSVVGLHTPVLFVDEGGFLPWSVWVELLPTVNTWEKGSQIFVGGTPSGERENNVLYFVDQESDEYNRHRISALDNPLYTEQAKRRDEDQYGIDTDDYRRLVFGEHASPVTMLFAKDTLPLAETSVFTAIISNKDLEEDPLKVDRLFSSLSRESDVAAGIDLGYADPTVISLFKNVRGCWKHFARIELIHIEYPKQIAFIDRLDSFYHFLFLGIDEGYSGIAVAQELTTPQYAHKNYAQRLTPVMFGNWETIGQDLDGNALKTRIKNIAVEKLRSMFDKREIELSSKDSKLLSELERVESFKNNLGRISYRVRTPGGSPRGEDHIFASFLCFTYAVYYREDKEQEEEQPIRLFTARWARR